MFKKITVITIDELELIAKELGFDNSEDVANELNESIDSGGFTTYRKGQLKEYSKYYSSSAIKVLEKFYDKHGLTEFMLVCEGC